MDLLKRNSVSVNEPTCLVTACPQMHLCIVYKCTRAGYKLHWVELEFFIRLFLSVLVNDFYSCSFVFVDGWTLSMKELSLLLFHCFVFQCLQSSGTSESQTPAVQSPAARQSPFNPPWVTYAPRHHTPREPLADTTSHLQARDCWFAKIPQEKVISEYVPIYYNRFLIMTVLTAHQIGWQFQQRSWLT